MRNIARFTGANVTGITINRYQVNRGNELNAQAGLKDQCKSVQVRWTVQTVVAEIQCLYAPYTLAKVVDGALTGLLICWLYRGTS